MIDSSAYENLGQFYLGRAYDLDAREIGDELTLYDSKGLVTHAVCVGMTGSGKTGLCLGLLEEAAMDGVPALIVDPKGDLANLLLTFPELRPEVNQELLWSHHLQLSAGHHLAPTLALQRPCRVGIVIAQQNSRFVSWTWDVPVQGTQADHWLERIGPFSCRS